MPQCPAQAEQRTANFIFASPTETDRLQVSYPRSSRVWSGFLDISAKGKDGETKSKRIPVSGEVNTKGVPVTITIPASQLGAADVQFGMFYDSDLNLQLVGNNNIPHPRQSQQRALNVLFTKTGQPGLLSHLTLPLSVLASVNVNKAVQQLGSITAYNEWGLRESAK